MTSPDGSIAGDVLFTILVMMAAGLVLIVWRAIATPDVSASPHSEFLDDYPTRQDVERRMRSAEGNGASVD